MNAPIQFIAPVAIQGEPGKAKRFSTLAYTGVPLRVAGYHLPIVVDLGGLSTRKTVTANLDHDSEKRVGHVDDVQNDGKQLRLSGLVSAANSAADEFLASASNGYPWQASIEAAPDAIDEIPHGKTAQANGRSFPGPLLVARKSVLSAVGFVPNGADDNTHVSIAAQQRKKRMSDFANWTAEMGADTSTMTELEVARLHANYSGRRDPAEADHLFAGGIIRASADDPVASESRRLHQIERACSGEWGDHGEKVNELKASAVGGTLTVDDLISELRPIRVEKLEAKIPMAYSVHSRGRAASDSKVIEAALIMSGGMSAEKHYDEKTLEAADRFKGLGLQQLLLHAAAQNGFDCPPGTTVTQGNLRRVLQAAFAPQIRASGFSTVSIPDVVSNVAEKFLFDGFNSVDQTILRISAIRSVNNFKTITTVSLLGGLTFEQVGPAGDIKHGTLSDQTYSNKADTFARMLTITRQDIINDDLGALTVAPRKLGRGAMLKLNDIGWTKFLNNSSFFTSGNNNVSTGGGSALSDAGLAAAEQKFLNQTDPDGNPLGILPAILLVPPTLKSTGRKLLASQFVIAGTATDTQPSGNIWQNQYVLESSPYMEISSYTGYSAAAWYLLAATSALPVIEIAALNGRVEPVVETAQADFETLGISMRGYSDVGVALQEYRGGVRSAGS